MLFSKTIYEQVFSITPTISSDKRKIVIVEESQHAIHIIKHYSIFPQRLPHLDKRQISLIGKYYATGFKIYLNIEKSNALIITIKHYAGKMIHPFGNAPIESKTSQILLCYAHRTK